ncbi:MULTISPECIES: recombinase family protein [Microbacterium]|uniref:recombinase family protein n=1 Tax=Microbacterium TaxID=33882 RepID=UPI0028E23067|nr:MULTISPECIES: recombinase family protein [Microbacterium]
MTTTTGRLIGYARVSTAEQDEAYQRAKLTEAGVQARDIYVDHGVSGTKISRPAWDNMLDEERGLQPGDTLVVWKLDRLGRNSGHVITTIETLVSRGIHVRTLDGIDTTTTTGKAMMGMLAVFAQMERDFNSERTRAALDHKREQGITGGRPRSVDTKQARLIQRMYDEGEKAPDIARTLKISRATVYRYLSAS